MRGDGESPLPPLLPGLLDKADDHWFLRSMHLVGGGTE